eukprot:scaffold344839_cov14-Prasinocladus_malaysianus.AAC.1
MPPQTCIATLMLQASCNGHTAISYSISAFPFIALDYIATATFYGHCYWYSTFATAYGYCYCHSATARVPRQQFTHKIS